MRESGTLSFQPMPCRAGTAIPLAFSGTVGDASAHAWSLCHTAVGMPLSLPVGMVISAAAEPSASFRVTGRAFLPGLTSACPVLLALADWPPALAEPLPESGTWSLRRVGFAVACITLSDKGYAGEREDKSGPRLAEMARAVLPICHEQRFVLPDDPAALRALVLELAVGQGYDLILTSGGTGVAPRDLTPEALLPVLSRRLPGFEQAMMAESLGRTPHAVLSRALAGTVGSCMVLALPGSVRGAEENLAAVLPALRHALDKLKGDPSDCGG